MGSAKVEGSSERRALNLKPENFDLVDLSIASACRWKPGTEEATAWREHLESLATYGQLEEGICAKVGDEGRLRLIIGSRRFRGLHEINSDLSYWQGWLDEQVTAHEGQDELKRIYQKARIRLNAPLPFAYKLREVDSDREAAMIAEEENIRRREMSPMDLATAVYGRTLRDEKQKDIANDFKFSNPNRVQQLLNYFELPERAQGLLHIGKMTEQLAKSLHGLKKPVIGKICDDIEAGKKASDLTRAAEVQHRESGERVARTVKDLRDALHQIGTPRALFLRDHIAGRPGIPELEQILEAPEAELPEYVADIVEPKKRGRAPLSDEEKAARVERRAAEKEAQKAVKAAERQAQKDRKKDERDAKITAGTAGTPKKAKAAKKSAALKAAKPKKSAPLQKPRSKKASPRPAAIPEGGTFDDELGEVFIDRSEEILSEAGSGVQAALRDRGSESEWQC